MNGPIVFPLAAAAMLPTGPAAGSLHHPWQSACDLSVDINRRDFLRYATVAALGAQARWATALPKMATCTYAGVDGEPDGPWRYRAFTEITGTAFAVGDERLLLDRVRLFPPHPGLESFCLYFHGPASRPLEERIHRFRHASRPDFDLFIQPGVIDADYAVHRAVVCRIVGPMLLGDRPV